ncbi:MAG TPA: GNAT family N-acetyltransferase [Anaerolineales bacterium]|nr:GNAT family N-acetyltransferase [Anaerolineales bacterium]
MPTPRTLAVRSATLTDLPELARLHQAFNGVQVTPQEFHARLANPLCVEQAFVAEMDGRVVGFAALRVVESIFYSDPQGEITELYVEKQYRRAGVARALLALAEQVAKARGVQEMVVLTGSFNRPARKLYQSLGYEAGEIALCKGLA